VTAQKPIESDDSARIIINDVEWGVTIGRTNGVMRVLVIKDDQEEEFNSNMHHILITSSKKDGLTDIAFLDQLVIRTPDGSIFSRIAECRVNDKMLAILARGFIIVHEIYIIPQQPHQEEDRQHQNDRWLMCLQQLN
tara:strand:- start:19136 stop:19546 length:411 start_codon:yes stop_codon:yes gene_type:complete